MRRLFGVLLLVFGAGLLALGGVGVAAFGVNGEMEESSVGLSSDKAAHALVADVLSIDAGFPGSTALGQVTIGAEALGGKPLFIGYGKRSMVDEYLNGVAFDAVSQQGSEWELKPVPGVRNPQDPAEEKFWIGQDAGFDAAVKFTPPTGSPASLVVMNRNGAAPVKARITMGYTSTLVFPLSLGALAVGAVLVIIGLVLLLKRKRSRRAKTKSAGQSAQPSEASSNRDEPVDPVQPASKSESRGNTDGKTEAVGAAGVLPQFDKVDESGGPQPSAGGGGGDGGDGDGADMTPEAAEDHDAVEVEDSAAGGSGAKDAPAKPQGESEADYPTDWFRQGQEN